MSEIIRHTGPNEDGKTNVTLRSGANLDGQGFSHNTTALRLISLGQNV